MYIARPKNDKTKDFIASDHPRMIAALKQTLFHGKSFGRTISFEITQGPTGTRQGYLLASHGKINGGKFIEEYRLIHPVKLNYRPATQIRADLPEDEAKVRMAQVDAIKAAREKAELAGDIGAEVFEFHPVVPGSPESLLVTTDDAGNERDMRLIDAPLDMLKQANLPGDLLESGHLTQEDFELYNSWWNEAASRAGHHLIETRPEAGQFLWSEKPFAAVENSAGDVTCSIFIVEDPRKGNVKGIDGLEYTLGKKEVAKMLAVDLPELSGNDVKNIIEDKNIDAETYIFPFRRISKQSARKEDKQTSEDVEMAVSFNPMAVTKLPAVARFVIDRVPNLSPDYLDGLPIEAVEEAALTYVNSMRNAVVVLLKEAVYGFTTDPELVGEIKASAGIDDIKEDVITPNPAFQI
ncbi:hypothetical protein [Alcanivorax sp. 1008]|uniref:hypothetical protein n=1 Tax=Alcanivorax sp. 1008 TaxID=2816853 RepID=UPI001D3FF3E0|nr:hypothetical protein [Alcanivorax sp. 1008]MCC1496908.1 hypothetical protein [Alcanivorax sp. 1008]